MELYYDRSAPAPRKTGKRKTKRGRKLRTLNGVTAHSVTEGDDKFMPMEQQLLPGIPSDRSAPAPRKTEKRKTRRGRKRRTLKGVTGPSVIEGDDIFMPMEQQLLTGIPNDRSDPAPRKTAKRKVKRDRKRRVLNGVTAPSVTKDDDKFMPMEQQLLPGIPDDITLEHIATKTDYESIFVLSTVSHAWKQASQDRLIHNARVRLHSTRTLDIWYCDPPFMYMCSRAGDQREVALFRSPWAKQCVALDGKVYSLGGWQTHTIQTRDHRNRSVERIVGLHYASSEVHVLDLAGCSKNWKRCASMHEARVDFVCGIKNGKIHILGGWNGHTTVDTAEVYDANNNSWSIMPIPRHWWHGFQYQLSVDV